MFTQEIIVEVDRVAERLDVNTACLLAVAEVESGGVALWDVKGKKLPPVRFEGHYFYKRLKGEQLKEAVSQGLANPNAGAIKNPSSYSARYDLIERAAKINREAAYESVSWGIGQVMGANWEDLEFDSVLGLVEMAKSGIVGQIDIMARFIEKNNLVDELQRKDWAGFAKRYNGPNYHVNKYDTKMAAAYARWYGSLKPDPKTFIKSWQTNLAKLGYKVGVIDGIVGKNTRAAVEKFQKDKGLVIDGKVGPMTLEAIDVALKAQSSVSADKTMYTGMVMALSSQGAQVAVDAINSQIAILKPLAAQLPYLNYGITALTIASVGFALWGVYKKISATKGLM